MLKGLGNIASMLRQAQQFSGKMQAVSERLRGERVTASTGGGMVTVEANGLGEIVRVTIDPDLVSRGEREMIEDLIPAAVNQVINKSRDLHLEAMKSLAQGLDPSALEELVGKMTTTDPDQE